MSHQCSRRSFIGKLGLALASGPSICSSEGKALPFCMFSLDGGWSDHSSHGGDYISTQKARTTDTSGVPQVVSQIERALQFDIPIDIYLAKRENNAFATVANGRKILVVDVDFLDSMNRNTHNEWSAIQVIAHEVGHHVSGFTPVAHVNELNADYWSGQTLQRLGSSLTSATTLIMRVGTEVDTNSHPNKYRRRDAITQGWNDAEKGTVDYRRCIDCR